MAQKSNLKTLGRPSGSLNAPIAAFTMAIILCGYCISSIRTARHEAQIQPPVSSSSRQAERKDASWIQQALQESQAERESSKGGKST
ncbi:uncharacterized protein N7483_012075 [Penicillium malachiteum]|uniref:uncharacterized protein n=1 Tax=Penicillium malachiteum TaxID=1324776 RepID=UPI002546E2C3|nr:uncharacterized protein N7483_012075 [Penicillium malachiteum]KAJ5714894.1 hypothetical protein N7483_012075 [Penicillium malachiteum]